MQADLARIFVLRSEEPVAEQSCPGAWWGYTSCFVPRGLFRWSVVRGCDVIQRGACFSSMWCIGILRQEFLGLKLYACIFKIHL